MPSPKELLTEQEAAMYFVADLVTETKDAWPAIYKELKGAFEEKFVIEDERMAPFDLALAAIALNLQAPKNLFPKDQAERIEKWVFKYIDEIWREMATEEWGDYAVEEVKKYAEKFQKAVEHLENPTSAIPARLLHRWLGRGIENFEVEMNGEKTGIISLQLIMMATAALSRFIGFWKSIKNDFDLVEGDLPFEDD